MIGKILIVDDVSSNRIVLKVKLGVAGYQALMAADGAQGIGMALRERPDMVLLDYDLPDMTAPEVLTRLRGDPATRQMPVVVFSGDAGLERRLAALRAGADDYLVKPMNDQALMARLRNLLRGREEGVEVDLPGLGEAAEPFEGPALVAIVTTARPEETLRLRRELRVHSRDAFMPLSPEAVFDKTIRPDVYLIDADLAEKDAGLRLMSELLSRQASRHAACCIRQDRPAPAAAAMAYDLGAQDMVGTEIPAEELALRLQRLVRRKREHDRLRAKVADGLRLAAFDPLTGLHNRRYAMTTLHGQITRAVTEQGRLAVMLLDIDRFKSVNDRFGHAAGDAVLVEVARRLACALGKGDLLARVGGEEFLVVLPDADLAQAEAVAARLCLAIRERRFDLPCDEEITVTASIGLTIAGPQEAAAPEAVARIVRQADVALMSAKGAGRDQVTVSRSAA